MTNLASFGRYNFTRIAPTPKHVNTDKKAIVKTPPKFAIPVGSAGSKIARNNVIARITNIIIVTYGAPRIFLS